MGSGSASSVASRLSMSATLLEDDAAPARKPMEPLEKDDIFRLIADSLPEGLGVSDAEGRLVYVNDRFCEMVGYAREELLGRRSAEFLDEANGAKLEREIDRRRLGENARYELEVTTREGGRLSTALFPRGLFDADGRFLGSFAVVADVSQKKRDEAQVERALRESEVRYHGLFEGVPVGLYRTTPAGVMLDANSTLVKILGFPSLESLLETRVGDLYQDPEDRRRWQQAIAAAASAQSFEARVRRFDGVVIWVRFTVRAFRGDDGEILRYEGALEDITDRHRAEEALRASEERFRSLVQNAPDLICILDARGIVRYESPSHCRVLGSEPEAHVGRRLPERVHPQDRTLLEHALRHLVGDELLIQLSGALAAALRPSDTIARVGGDEFAILLEGGRDVSDAVRVADRIHDRLSTPTNLGGHEVFITASIGIAVHTPEYERPEDLLRDADTAMYRAKTSGRACHVVFNRVMHRFVMARLQLETDLRRAVERGQLRVHYQPFVDLATDEVTGFEALVRWHHPRRGLLPPDEFLSVAEETGLIVPIGRFVLIESCRQIGELQRKHREMGALKLTVNLSNKQFFQADLFDQIAEALATSGLDPACLGLEITEGVIIRQADSASGRFSRLKGMGVQLYLDDFGKGYSSLNYLHRFPMDLLKIDRSFVSRVEEADGNLAILEAIVTLAHQLGMEVVAEGIQTAGQVKKIRSLGCEYGQGFYLSHPLPADEAELLLMRRVKTLTP